MVAAYKHVITLLWSGLYPHFIDFARVVPCIEHASLFAGPLTFVYEVFWVPVALIANSFVILYNSWPHYCYLKVRTQSYFDLAA